MQIFHRKHFIYSKIQQKAQLSRNNLNYEKKKPGQTWLGLWKHGQTWLDKDLCDMASVTVRIWQWAWENLEAKYWEGDWWWSAAEGRNTADVSEADDQGKVTEEKHGKTKD